MVDFARPADKKGLKSIWSVCFGGPEEYLDFYYNRRFQPKETLVWREDGRPVAMMTLMEVRISGRKGAYIYAVATLPEYRRRGLMARLELEARQKILQQGGCFSVLVPAEKGLFAMYEKLGYHTVSFLWEGEELRGKGPPVQLSRCGFREFSRLRGEYLAGFPQAAVHPAEELRYIYRELCSFSGGISAYREGDRRRYAAYTLLEDGRVWLRECSGDNPSLAAQALLHRFRRPKALLFSGKPFPGAVRTPYGMGRALSPEGEGCLEELYMSLMLD